MAVSMSDESEQQEYGSEEPVTGFAEYIKRAQEHHEQERDRLRAESDKMRGFEEEATKLLNDWWMSKGEDDPSWMPAILTMLTVRSTAQMVIHYAMPPVKTLEALQERVADLYDQSLAQVVQDHFLSEAAEVGDDLPVSEV